MAETHPEKGMPTVRKTFNQLTCWYQFRNVRGVSETCGRAMMGGKSRSKGGKYERWPPSLDK